MKEAYFCSHDYNARQDPKMQEVLMDLGVAGLGIYWCVIEQLYEQGGSLPLSSIKAIAFTLHANIEDVRNLVENYGLFENDGTEFWSPRVARNIDGRRQLSEKRSNAIAKRWSKNTKSEEIDTNVCETDTNVLQKSENSGFCNTIKGKEIKENKRKENNNSSLSNAQVCASEEERERFLEIFSLVLNFQEPQQEVERFVAHYEANGWCRNNSTVPVKNKEALARSWTPRTQGIRYPEEVRQWLLETYGKAKAHSPTDAALLLREIDGATITPQGDRRDVRLRCTKAVAGIVEKYYAQRPMWRLSYRIPN
jgi:uncharacterized protein YdaU (DUF1376 family)